MYHDIETVNTEEFELNSKYIIYEKNNSLTHRFKLKVDECKKNVTQFFTKKKEHKKYHKKKENERKSETIILCNDKYDKSEREFNLKKPNITYKFLKRSDAGRFCTFLVGFKTFSLIEININIILSFNFKQFARIIDI